MRQHVRGVGAVAAACVLLSGCASTTLQTARRLEAGDMVVSGSVDELGTFVVPRFGAQFTYGLGKGDVAAHVGSSIFLYNAGLTGRFYGGKWINVSGEFDANTIPFEKLTLYSATLRLTNAVYGKGGFYGGVHLATHGLREDDIRRITGGTAGLVAGVDVLVSDDFAIQLEARFSPLLVSAEGAVGVFPLGDGGDFGGDFIVDSLAAFTGQLGFAIHKRIAAREAIPGSPPIEQWNDTDNDFEPPPKHVTPAATQPDSSSSAPLLRHGSPQQPAAPQPTLPEPVPQPTPQPEPEQGEESAPVPPLPE